LGNSCVAWNRGKTLEEIFGKERSREIREKISRGHKGQRAWNKGKKLSPLLAKHKRKLSEAHKRKAAETSLRMKELWENPKYREGQVKAHKHPNPKHGQIMRKMWQDPNYRENQRIKHLGRKLSKEAREKLSESLRRLVLPEEELRRLYLKEKLSTIKMAKLYGVSQGAVVKRLKAYGIKLRPRSEALKGNTIGKQFRDKISKAKKGKRSSPATEFKKGFKASKEWRNLWAKIMKKKWDDPSYVKKVMKARHAHPNNSEMKLIKILDRNQLPFSYTGDGKVTIGGLCPDFIHNNGDKKVMELFGRIYHDPDVSFKDEIPWCQQYFGRMAYYSQFGYNCLIIWDDELNNEVKVAEKIRRFSKCT
jgi:hypothetical protein